jgi:hypothetical protein
MLSNQSVANLWLLKVKYFLLDDATDDEYANGYKYRKSIFNREILGWMG